MNSSIANGQPISCISACDERLRQAFVGYENLPQDTEMQPLRLYVYDSHSQDKLRLGVNEFQTLVNRLPMATVCSEARSQAATFCQAQTGFLNLFYVITGNAFDESRDIKPSDIRNEILEPVFKQQTTVMVTNAHKKKDGPKGFHSAEHLVDVINRVFGSCVERIILSSWFMTFESLEEIYWPHTAETRKLGDM
jgi:hypothetical protein